jgi:hypothetical protein
LNYSNGVRNHKRYKTEKLLTKCSFKLGVPSASGSEIFISNLGRLYLAMSAEVVVPELVFGGSASGSNGSASVLEAFGPGSVASREELDSLSVSLVEGEPASN